MSTKLSSAKTKKKAIDAVIEKLRHEQSKLRRTVNRRTYDIKNLVEKQTQEKRQIAELGLLITNVESNQDGE